MTRQEFIQNITTWRQLLDFCYEYGCGACENIIPYDELRDCIAEDFNQYAYTYSWVDIRDWLNSINNNASFYYCDGSFDYTSVDDDFAFYKQDVLDWCDEDASVFDEYEGVEYPFETESGNDEIELSDGDCTDDDLLKLIESKFY